MKPFEYLQPETLREAVDALSKGGARLLAGGTDLLVRLRRGEWTADRVINLKRIPELRGIRGEGDGLVIGPLTTVEEILESDLVSRRFPLLAEASRLMASPQVRNLATIGGNICNASPAADLAPPLLCLEAKLRAVGPEGERDIPVTEFFKGPGESALASDEILTGIRVPAPVEKGAFLKFCPRTAMDLAFVNVACARADGEMRAAVGAAAPTPIRVPPSPDEAAEMCSPIDDVRATAGYRKHLVRVLLRRALEKLS